MGAPSTAEAQRQRESLPLLRTKLAIPRVRERWVVRARLLRMLDVGASVPLTLVCAPAGFGKTSLAAEWAASSRAPVAWLSLDPSDNDPARFLAYITAALGTRRTPAGGASREEPGPERPDAGLVSLINGLSEASGEQVLVLDDYQFITEQAVHELLAYLVEHLPPNAHLMLLSRSEPPLALARLRACGHLVEIRAADLRFTAEEMDRFFRHVAGVPLSCEDLAILETRTEGWVAGLQMAGLSLQGRSDVPALVRAFSGSHSYVLDYLSEEVLSHRSDETRAFLLQTSILDRLCGSLCDAVTGRSGGQQALENLERANLFLVPLDEHRQWYRYHHLFADLLRMRLHRLDPALVRTLHLRAADWCEREGLPEAAAHHALEAGDPSRAARLIEANALALLERSEYATLISGVGALPPDLLHTRPKLCVYAAWALMFAGRSGEVAPLLREAEKHARPGDPASADVLAWVGMNRANEANFRGEPERAVELVQLAVGSGGGVAATTSAISAFPLGYAYFSQGDTARAEEAWAHAWRLGEAAGNPYIALSAICELAIVRKVQGRLREASVLYDRALHLVAEQHVLSQREAGVVNTGMGDLLRERHRLDEAERYLTSGLEQLRGPGNAYTRMWGYTSLARLHCARGELEQAREALQGAERLLEEGAYPESRARLDGCRVCVWAASGGAAAAEAWAEERLRSPLSPLTLVREMEQVALARALLAARRYGEAEGLLEEAAQSADAGGRKGLLIEILALQALLIHAKGEINRALRLLTRSLTPARPEGYVRTIADEGAPMAALLQGGLRRGEWHEDPALRAYAQRLLAAANSSAGEAAVRSQSISSSALAEALTGRELEVLRLVAEGMTNSEIAQVLVVTIGTVRVHTSRVYQKLDVTNRTAAVARARELGLL